jgi:hypothetical protein
LVDRNNTLQTPHQHQRLFANSLLKIVDAAGAATIFVKHHHAKRRVGSQAG